MRRSRLARRLSLRSHVRSISARASCLLTALRAAYFGSSTCGRRIHARTVFLDSPVRLETSRNDTPSRKCIRLILANIPTSITPSSPASFVSGTVNHVGQF